MFPLRCFTLLNQVMYVYDKKVVLFIFTDPNYLTNTNLHPLSS